MADFVTQQENNIVDTRSVIVEETQNTDVQPIQEEERQIPSSSIIWTPYFIVLFFLTLVIGLSVESLLTQGWLNGGYRAEWVLLFHALFILAGFIMLSVKARSMWVRVGGISGCTWAFFTGAGYVATLLGISGRSLVLLQFHAVTACALFATFIYFSTHRIVFRRWDNLFFWLAPFVGAGAIAVLYILSRNDSHHMRVLVSAATNVLLALSFATWWLRPSCWKSQPCVTFLFGIATVLLFFVPLMSDDVLGTPFFFSQVTLLCMLLAVMRVVQGEIQNDTAKGDTSA